MERVRKVSILFLVGMLAVWVRGISLAEEHGEDDFLEEVERALEEDREGRETRRGHHGEGQEGRGAEMRQRIEAFLQEHIPEFLEELRQMELESPREFKERFREVAEQIHHLEQLKRHHPERFEQEVEDRRLDFRSHRLARRFERADEGEREAILGELREVLEKQFALRQERRKRELEEMKGQVQGREKEIKQREGNKEQMIERRLARLTGQEAGDEW
jgi:hypothetical protein